MKVLELLDHLDPAMLDYSEWCSVGMALKHEGATASDWDAWSRRDSERYKPTECYRKWEGFNGSATPVTAGTIYALAERQGFRPQRESRAFDWNDVIGRDDLRVIDTGWVEDAEVHDPGEAWDAVGDVTRYLSALFEAGDYVGYVVDAWPAENGRTLPKKGSYTRTAGELLAELATCGGDLGKVFGDYDPEVGAWIRPNPLDGRGVRDDNVTAFRYALIESDTIPIERQAAIYEELELPVAALVHSGKKSLHAIVRVDASSKEEYRQRVNFLHEVCRKNGLDIDTQNKNPSRLSRLPGVWRNGQKQYLVGTNQGKASWEEWKHHVEEANDSLPDFESLSDCWAALPPLSPPLIDGVLRQGHKMLLAGPSKAGKSYILLQLAMAIAEGRDWLGWHCTQGRVLYVNLELDRASCLHRLKTLYEAHGWTPANVENIDLWNLRGKALPMDALAPRLIRRAIKRRYAAIIIDPIYKVLTGDENAAHEMAVFCNQFDRLATELQSAVIYCHHHSKGSQGQKNSRDRSSGSGVFARDPDAILDMIELMIDGDRRTAIDNRVVCPVVSGWLDAHGVDWRDRVAQDDTVVADKFIKAADDLVGGDADFREAVRVARAAVANISGWRLEATLREFAPFKPTALFFRYPIHVHDTDGLLLDAKADGEEAPWISERRKAGKHAAKKSSKKDRLVAAYNECMLDGMSVRAGDLAERMGVDVRTVHKWLESVSAIVQCGDGLIRSKAEAQEYQFERAYTTVRDLAGRVTLSDLCKQLDTSESTLRRQIEAMDGRYVVKMNVVSEVDH